MNAARPRLRFPRRVIAPEPRTDADLADMAKLAKHESNIMRQSLHGNWAKDTVKQPVPAEEIDKDVAAYLATVESCTVAGLAEAINVAPATANKRLRNLCKAGRVRRTREGREGGRGSGPYIYEVVR